MPAPEIWGPAVWNLFHTLIEQLNEDAYQAIAPQLYSQFVKICKFLPCPDCASDATNFLAKVNLTHIKSKIEFRNTFYLFHNWVNARKRKPLFNYGNILIYSKYNIIVVINKFLSVYHTKGNMKMLNESFQRSLIVSTFKGWFTSVISAFMPAPKVEQPITIEVKEEVTAFEEPNSNEEKVAAVEEPISNEEEVTVVVEEEVTAVEEPISNEEEITAVAVEEPISNEEEVTEVAEEEVTAIVEEEVTAIVEEEHIVEESIVEKVLDEVENEVLNDVVKVEEKPKGKKGKKGKK
jgi:hypothetical protein